MGMGTFFRSAWTQPGSGALIGTTDRGVESELAAARAGVRLTVRRAAAALQPGAAPGNLLCAMK